MNFIIILLSLLVIGLTTTIIIFLSQKSSEPITPKPNDITTPSTNIITTPSTNIITTSKNILTKITQIWSISGGVNHPSNKINVCLSRDGSTLAVAYYIDDNSNGSSTGTTRVWKQSGVQWVRLGQDIEQGCNSISLSNDGSIIAIGADKDNGFTRIFQINNNQWIKLGGDITGKTFNERSGFSVSLSSNGTRIAIGAPGHSESKGVTRVYQLIGNEWSQIGSDIIGKTNYGLCGYSVSLSANGNRVAVGSPGVNNKVGMTMIYDFSNNSWSYRFGEILGSLDALHSGACVSLSSDGNIIAISQPSALGRTGYSIIDKHPGSKGITRIYNISGNSLQLIGNEILGNINDFSGVSISLAGNGSSIVIGSPYANDLRGLTRIYKLSNGSWIQFDEDIKEGNGLIYNGISVSLSENGSTVAVGTIEANIRASQDFLKVLGIVKVYNV